MPFLLLSHDYDIFKDYWGSAWDKISVIEFYLYDFKVEAIDEESEFLNDN